jgi:hypothetical protein
MERLQVLLARAGLQARLAFERNIGAAADAAEDAKDFVNPLTYVGQGVQGLFGL